jgi:hypothetical protein
VIKLRVAIFGKKNAPFGNFAHASLEFAPRGDTLFSKAKALAARMGVEADFTISRIRAIPAEACGN